MAANSRFAVAVHILVSLAYQEEHPITSESLAESVNTNPVVIRRILSELTKAGLVRAQPGKSGGSKLAKKANRISLYDIYRVIEVDGLFGMHQKPENKKCPVSCRMKKIMTDVFDTAEAAMHEKLKTVFLSDLVSQV